MAKLKYPPHLYDPLRRKIATDYIHHELRKLFPSIRDKKMWAQLDNDVLKWWNENPTMAPIRDFWNGLHGISMGFKLKNIAAWLTSANIKWEEKETSIENLWFGSTLDDLKQISEKPSAKEVRDWFFDPSHKSSFDIARQRAQKEVETTTKRNHFPIIAIKKQGKLIVTDGNRRLLQTILENKDSILAAVGEPIAEPLIFESWIPTSMLCELVSLNRYWSTIGIDRSANFAEIIAELIKTSLAGRIEFLERATQNSLESDLKLVKIVEELLNLKNITLV